MKLQLINYNTYCHRSTKTFFQITILLFLIFTWLIHYQISENIPRVIQRLSDIQAKQSSKEDEFKRTNFTPETDLEFQAVHFKFSDKIIEVNLHTNENDTGISQASPRPRVPTTSKGVNLIYLPWYLKFSKRSPDYKYEINVSLSDRLALNRPVLDTRPTACLNLTFDLELLPAASVIVPFYNEAVSLLLRTLHGILEHTPAHILREVILVDDKSSNLDLGYPLERYLKEMNNAKVRLIRNKIRQGLIRSRQIGGDLSRGEVLVFQDAHTENNVAWLEPMLEQIVKNQRVVVQPMVDPIDKESLKYGKSMLEALPRTTFTWDLRLVWTVKELDPQGMTSPHNDAEPFNVPALVGCVFAVERRFFQELGGFDTDMDLWGGENLEVAFRAWMCGGRVISHPCSRVGHIYRPLPYISENRDEISRNLARVAEIWMDQYKHLYFATQKKMVKLKHTDHVSIARRKQLKAKLQCKSFRWYIDNVLTDMPIPDLDSNLYGHILNNQASAGCLGLSQDGGLQVFDFCNKHTLIPYLFFALNNQRQLYHVLKERCVYVDVKLSRLYTAECSVDGHLGHWLFKYHFSESSNLGLLIFVLKDYHTCLTYSVGSGEHTSLDMKDCLPYTHSSQLWSWTYKFTQDDKQTTIYQSRK